MALDERARLEMRQAVVELLGPEHGNRLMDQVPPFDWADVAMKQDLVALEARMDERFDNIDRRFENIDRRFENIDRQFSTVHAQFDTVNYQLKALLARPENNRALYLAVIGVIFMVASLTFAAAQFTR